MAPSLRQHRRDRTAHDIQLVTLRLARLHGFETVTTGMIAKDAGISARTFFNYYTNKEAAAVGLFQNFSEASIKAFAQGGGRVAEDLETLIRAYLKQLADRRDTIRAVAALAPSAPTLQLRRLEMLRDLQGRLVEVLALRITDADRGVLEMMADITIAGIRQTVLIWTEHEGPDLVEAADIAFARLRHAAALSTQ